MLKNSIVFCRLAVGTALILLFGCGSGDENDDRNDVNTSKPTEVLPITALDGLSVATPGMKSFIDLSGHVLGGKAELTSIHLFGENSHKCSPAIPNGIGFTITPQNGEVCDYQFTVSNAQVTDSARMTVLTTTDINPVLPPLSQPLLLEPTTSPAELNVEAMLKELGEWEDGYSLDSEGLVVQSPDDNNIGQVNADGNTIEYTLPSATGWNIINYKLINNEDKTRVKVGDIYITISDTVRPSITIKNKKHDYNIANNNAIVNTRDSIDIDLSQLVDADDDNWQLVDVQSYNASVTPKEPDNITNKVLEFTAAMPGEHIISYVIADHYNNFSYGLVKVSVTAKESEIDWGDLNVLNKKFISPVTYSDGIESGFHVFPLWDSVKSNTISGYNIFSGDAYCRTLGNLPTEEQMNALHVKHYELNGSGELNKWPMEKKYLIKDNASYFSYDISSGLKGEKVTASSGAYYVTCIQDENISLSTVGNIEINPDDKNERVLFGTITKHPDMNVAIYQIPELDGGGNLLGSDVDLLVSGSGSELSITTLNNELGTYAIKVMDTSNPENYITSQLVNYIPRTLASATIDIVKTRNGKLFTNSPSVAYLKKINGQSIADAIQKEGEKGKDAQGPAGDFYKFNFEHAENLCDHYNTLSIGDRDDWRLPTKKELKDQLFKEFDNMFEARGWPTAIRYWTKTSTDPNTYNTVRLSNGAVGSNPNEENNNYYVSCVSGPEKPDLAGEEIDFVYDKYGNLFTSSPSDAYLRSIGGPNYDRYNIGDGIKGPEGKFGLFNWENAKKVCDTYKKKKIHSRDNWRLPSQEELQRLYFKDGAGPNAFDFFNKHGWPVSNYYWTRTLVDTIYPDKYYFSFSLFNGNYYSRVLKETLFVSCVSVPDS